MKKVILQGADLNPERIKAEIKSRATEKVQGACAVIKKLDGTIIANAFLFIDNGRIMFEENRKIAGLVLTEIESIEF